MLFCLFSLDDTVDEWRVTKDRILSLLKLVLDTGLLTKEHIFLQQIDAFLLSCFGIPVQWSAECYQNLFEFSRSLSGICHEAGYNLLRGPCQSGVDTETSDLRTYVERMHLCLPSIRTIQRSRCVPSFANNGISTETILQIFACHLARCNNSGVIEGRQVRLIPGVILMDGTALKPGIAVLGRKVVGFSDETLAIDDPRIVSLAEATSYGSARSAFNSLPPLAKQALETVFISVNGIDAHFVKCQFIEGGGRSDVVRKRVDTVQSSLSSRCKQCIEQNKPCEMPDECAECMKAKTVCVACSEAGYEHWHNSMRPCAACHCQGHVIRCCRILPMAYSSDSESAQLTYMKGLNDQAQGSETGLLPFPDAPHVLKNCVMAMDNWWMVHQGCLFSLKQLHSLFNSHQPFRAVARLQSILITDRMHVGNVVHLCRPAVTSKIPVDDNCRVLTTVCPEMVKFVPPNSKNTTSFIKGPVTLCNGTSSHPCIYLYCAGNCTLFEVQLHNPAVVREVASLPETKDAKVSCIGFADSHFYCSTFSGRLFFVYPLPSKKGDNTLGHGAATEVNDSETADEAVETESNTRSTKYNSCEVELAAQNQYVQEITKSIGYVWSLGYNNACRSHVLGIVNLAAGCILGVHYISNNVGPSKVRGNVMNSVHKIEAAEKVTCCTTLFGDVSCLITCGHVLDAHRRSVMYTIRKFVVENHSALLTIQPDNWKTAMMSLSETVLVQFRVDFDSEKSEADVFATSIAVSKHASTAVVTSASGMFEHTMDANEVAHWIVKSAEARTSEEHAQDIFVEMDASGSKCASVRDVHSAVFLADHSYAYICGATQSVVLVSPLRGIRTFLQKLAVIATTFNISDGGPSPVGSPSFVVSQSNLGDTRKRFEALQQVDQYFEEWANERMKSANLQTPSGLQGPNGIVSSQTRTAVHLLANSSVAVVDRLRDLCLASDVIPVSPWSFMTLVLEHFFSIMHVLWGDDMLTVPRLAYCREEAVRERSKRMFRCFGFHYFTSRTSWYPHLVVEVKDRRVREALMLNRSAPKEISTEDEEDDEAEQASNDSALEEQLRTIIRMYLPSSRQSSVRQRQKGFTGKLPGIMAIKEVRTLVDPQSAAIHGDRLIQCVLPVVQHLSEATEVSTSSARDSRYEAGTTILAVWKDDNSEGFSWGLGYVVGPSKSKHVELLWWKEFANQQSYSVRRYELCLNNETEIFEKAQVLDVIDIDVEEMSADRMEMSVESTSVEQWHERAASYAARRTVSESHSMEIARTTRSGRAVKKPSRGDP
jgi:hypothetical protein